MKRFFKKTILFTLIFLLSCAGGHFSQTVSAKMQPLDRIVLVVIDTLRADHLGAHGYLLDTSPFFDQLARKGILFTNHKATTSTTGPSHASLFTSRYLARHGVLKNGIKLDSHFLTMAETFEQMGYQTAGFVSVPSLFPGSNLHQGFGKFDSPGKNDDTQQVHYRRAEKTIRKAMDWLSTRLVEDRFFLWIHLYDPHWPRKPPEKHVKAIQDTLDTKTILRFWTEHQKIDAGFFSSEQEMVQKITSYDGEIHYADHQLQRLYEFYRHNGFDQNSLWVITSDHGEGLGNHRWFDHGKYIYNEQLHVPLLFKFSSHEIRAKIIDTLTENIDIFPTLLELVDSNSPVLKSLYGQSLVSLMFKSDKSGYEKPFTFSQRRIYNKPGPEVIIPEVTNYEPGESYAIESRRYKYIYRTEGKDEFFDLINDPYETKNLMNTGLAEERRMRETLLNKMEELKSESPIESLPVDAETLKQLKSLGYIQ